MNKIAISLLSIIISSVSLASAASFTFSKSAYTVAEGLRAVVTVIPHDVTEPTTVTIKVEKGTASAGSDFIVPGLSGYFSIPFAKGDTEGKIFGVQTNADSVTDSNETIKASIIKINNVAITPITTTIDIQDVKKGQVSSALNQSTTGGQTTADTVLHVEVDKLVTTQNELFKVTVTGLPSRYFTSGYLLRFSRVGAPASSCENASRSDLCQVGVGISCGILPKYMGVSPAQWYADSTGKIEYICYANGQGATTVNTSDQIYNVKAIAAALIPYTGGQVTPPMVSANVASITMKANGVKATTLTNYGPCDERGGQGIDPFRIYRGCTDCEYIAAEWRTTQSTCQNVAAVQYRWNMHTPPSSIFDHPKLSCSFSTAGLPAGDTGISCSKGAAACQVGTSATDTNAKIFNCTPNGEASFEVAKNVSGVVRDTTGKPVAGVNVVIPMVGFGGSYTATTDTSGRYAISNVEPAFVSLINFNKAGYIADGMLAKLGENEAFILRPLPANGEPEVCPINTFRSTLGHAPCNCPEGTVKEAMQGGFICKGTTSTGEVNSNPITISPEAGTLYTSQGSSVTFTVGNAKSGDIQACYAVVANPTSPASVNATYCNTTSNFVDFNGNDDWNFVGNTLVGKIVYDQSTWGTGGIKTVSYFRKKSSPNNIVTATIEVKSTSLKSSATIGRTNSTIDQPASSSTGGYFGTYGVGGSAGGNTDNTYTFGGLWDTISNGVGSLMGNGSSNPQPMPSPSPDEGIGGGVGPNDSNGPGGSEEFFQQFTGPDTAPTVSGGTSVKDWFTGLLDSIF